MSEHTLHDVDTVVGGRVATGDSPSEDVALTILWHADPARVGEVSRLVGLSAGRAEVSRNGPSFSPPAGGAARPLHDAGISRRPFRITKTPGGVSVDPDTHTGALRLDGQPMLGPRAIAGPELDRGVVLQPSERIVLLLHTLGPPAAPGESLGLVGDSPPIQRLRAAIRRVADLPVNVLIRGESGSGKELVARAIHAIGRRAHKPFVAVNIGAVPGSVASSELFGHARGAFTGAVASTPGVFVQADAGTLFLDEIADAPPEIQVALLRAVETGEIRPVGGQATVAVDVRLIAATDADLEAAVESGRFRLALLERLGGYQLEVPPLRDRRDDVARLFVAFLREELAVLGDPERLQAAAPGEAQWVPGRIVARFCGYRWPGNVRQLRNMVRQLLISNRGRDQLELDPVLERTLGAAPPPSPLPPTSHGARPSTLDDTQLAAALREHGWRYAPTAEFLGISKNTLFARIDRSPTLRRPRDIEAAEIRDQLDRHGGDEAAAAGALCISTRGLRLRMRELGLARS